MLHPAISTQKSLIHGYGLFATETIPQGTIVWKLDPSERKLTYEELRKLPKKQQDLAYQYKDRFILVTDGSGVMNHSCDPNTWMQGDEKLIARRDVQKGEEVTYDYGTTEIDPRHEGVWRCRCGAKNCRGYIRATDCLNSEFQARYAGHLASWVEEFIKHSTMKNI